MHRQQWWGSCWGWKAVCLCKAEQRRRGGEGRGWACVPALDQTNSKEVDFKDLRVAGELCCGGWGILLSRVGEGGVPLGFGE